MKNKINLWAIFLFVAVLSSCSENKQEELLDQNGKFSIEIESQFFDDNGVLTRAENEMGYTTGAGLYSMNEQCTVAAFSKDGYELETFTDNDLYSGSNSYTFKVKGPKKFVAKFQSSKKLVYTLVTTKDNERVSFPDIAGENLKINYGDGSTEEGNQTSRYHTYNTAGIYTVQIRSSKPVTSFTFARPERDVKVKDIISNSLDLSQITSAGSMFNGTEIETICSGFFDSCKESLTDAKFTFQKCKKLKNIPEGLFNGCRKIKTFYECFRESGIRSIPANTFEGCTGAIDMQGLFQQCESLVELPAGLMNYCINVESLQLAFSGLNVSSIPTRFLSNCTKVKNINNIFSSCKNLNMVPYDIFDGCVNIESVDQAFHYSSNISSKVPDLWNVTRFPNIKSYYQCYTTVTKASNYGEIPANWKSN